MAVGIHPLNWPLRRGFRTHRELGQLRTSGLPISEPPGVRESGVGSVLNLLARFGRNFFVKAPAELLGNVAADAVFYLSDSYNNFLANTWAGPDEVLRWHLAPEKATNVLVAGEVSEALTDPVVDALCLTGAGCGPAAVAQGAVTRGVEGTTGTVTDMEQAFRHGVCRTPIPTPSGQS
jgi:hypothetical protein